MRKDGWKFTTMVRGALCVMMVGVMLMPAWCVGSLVTVELHLHVHKLSLVKAVDQSTMTMLSAVEVRHASLTAPILVLEIMTANTAKMQEWCVTLQ